MKSEYDRGHNDGFRKAQARNSGYQQLLDDLHDIYYDLANWKYPYDELAMDKLKKLFDEHLDKRLPKYAWDE